MVNLRRVASRGQTASEAQLHMSLGEASYVGNDALFIFRSKQNNTKRNEKKNMFKAKKLVFFISSHVSETLKSQAKQKRNEPQAAKKKQEAKIAMRKEMELGIDYFQRMETQVIKMSL